MIKSDNDIQNLTGKILLATPNISDTYMPKSMILVCKHNKNGASGVIINKTVPEIGLFSLLMSLNIQHNYLGKYLYIGGNQNIDSYYILHTNKNISINTVKINNNLFLTETDDLIEALSFVDQNTERKIICIGCYMWEPLQLEQEIASNYWTPIKADEALIFGDPTADKWSKAFLKIGLHSPLFVDKFGKA